MPSENFLNVFFKLNKCLSSISRNINNPNHDSSPDFTRMKNFLEIMFSIETLSNDQREEFSGYLAWLFNELIYISVTAKELQVKTKKNSDFSVESIQLQSLFLTVAYKKERWWFFKLITAYTLNLKQLIALQKNNSKELIAPFVPSKETVIKRRIELVFHKLLIDNEVKVNEVIHICLSVLTSSAQLYCNMKKDIEIESRDVILQVFHSQSVFNKHLSVLFFSEYFNTVAEFSREHTLLFISVMHTMAIIFKDIPSMIQENDLEKLVDSIIFFFSDIPVQLMDFTDAENLRLFVTHSSEILFHQIVNSKKPWFIAEIHVKVLFMLTKVLDNIDYTPASVESLRHLLDLQALSSDIKFLMKYLIIAEVEDSNVKSFKLTEMSSTWKTLHDQTTKINNEKLNKKPELFDIADFLVLAVQIDFSLTHRHQLQHGLSPQTCFCLSIPNLIESQEPMMQFKDWKYKNIPYVVIENLNDFTQKLLSSLEEFEVLDAEIVRCSIDIFSCILKFSSTSTIVDTIKQILVAIIASPFYKCLKDNPDFSRLGGFQKVMTLLPCKFKLFFETHFKQQKVLDAHLNKLKCDSIVQLSQLQISRVNNPCWWLIENLINFISKHGSAEIKTTLFKYCFTNFVINNSDKFSFCAKIYQNLLAEMKDSCILISQLHNVLCLTGEKHLILKVPAKDNIFMHSFICDDCELTIKYPKVEGIDNEVKRWMALIKDTRGILISPDIIKNSVKINLNVPIIFAQSNEFKIELFSKIPSMLNHSQDFKSFVEKDKGKALFEGIFLNDEKILEQLVLCLKDIIRNIAKMDFSEQLKKEIFDNCFAQLAKITTANAYGTDEKMQSLIVNLTFIFATNVVNENNMAKCFKIFSYFIVQNNSHYQVMGEASRLSLQMANWNGISLEDLLSWYRTFIMCHVVRLFCTNFFLNKTSLAGSFANFQKRLNFPPYRDFIRSNLATIISVVLPMGIDEFDRPRSSGVPRSSDNLLESLEKMSLAYLPQALEENFIKIYFHIYIKEKPEVCEKCLRYIEQKTEISVHALLTREKTKTVEEALIYYNKSPKFVHEVMGKMLENNSDSDMIELSIIEDIKDRFLGLLIYFETFLVSSTCERVIKKDILLSLGDVIRLLGAEHISGFCFKIIKILNTAVEQTSVDLSEYCINVWDILIRTCEVTSLAPILSTVIVSLEYFVQKYPKKVRDLHKYLIVHNSTLLGQNITDLFFVEKTQIDDDIKGIVLSMIDSQKAKEKDNFLLKFKSILRQMNSENHDLKIRVYCLQYLKELIQKNRVGINELICSRMTMDPMIEELLHSLLNNCKTTSSEAVQLATAECLGELGAIEPSLQPKNYSSQQQFPKTIHCDEFAKMALIQLCRSYQYKNESKYDDALSLAIQEILKSRNVKFANKDENAVWKAIPQKMQPLMETLLTSKYSPKPPSTSVSYPIFWQALAQTPIDWAYRFASKLIEGVSDDATKELLMCLRPSMKHNQHTSSLFMPYILLHNLTTSDKSTHKEIHEEIQMIFDIVTGNNVPVLENKDENALYVKWFDFKPFEAVKMSPQENGIKVVAIKVAKMIFEIFDFLENYHRSQTRNDNCGIIKNFLDDFDKEELAQVNYICGEYARAMIYLETKLKELKVDEEFQSKLSFLTNIYAKLECSDSVEGVQALKTSEWSLEEKILINNVTGNFQDSAACFERLMQIGDSKVEHIQCMMNTYISLDQPETALLVYENMIQKLNAQQKNLCKEIKAEPLWRLSRFDELDELLKDKTVQQSSDWGVSCGRLLSAFNKLKLNELEGTQKFSQELYNTRLAMMKNLKISGSEQTAYGKNYRGIINLHLISEVEKAEAVVEKINKQSMTQQKRLKALNEFISESNTRMEFIRKNSTFEETVLGFHRIILSVTRSVLENLRNDVVSPQEWNELCGVIDGEMGKLWIKSTKLACKNMKYQQAQTFILNAEPYQPKTLFIAKAKLHWNKKDQNNAFKTLELGTKKIWNEDGNQGMSQEEKEIYSKGKLMIANYNAEATNVDFETNKNLFFEAKMRGAENEKLFLKIAEYMDRFYCTEGDNQSERIGEPNKMRELMIYYSRSLAFGSEYVFQSMPRLLSIWLDTTGAYYNQSNSKALIAELAKLNETAEKVVNTLDIFYFYTAFSQLISRICHPSPDVFNVLKTILVKLMVNFPQQSLWFLIPMLKSSHPPRVKKGNEILNDPRVKDMQTLIKDFNWLVDKFVELASLETNDSSNAMLDSKVAALNGLQKKSSIILPFQCNLHLTRVGKHKSFKFADKPVFIQRVKSKIEVMKSLQRPKKMGLIGSDGKVYWVLVKYKDDLRIDQRYCEFSNVVKEFLHKDPESRHRQLTTRTYSVIPLKENAGLIEWVENLRTYKDVVVSQYGDNKKKGHKLMSMSEIRKLNMNELSKDKRAALFRKLQENYYPALGDYYRRQFATPQNYYKARSAFIKTTATMSIIGYILGLGDRHCENILIDELTGETFHVDFNMLFNRGEDLNVPETVPFRLTHNMIDAMGVLGIEGPFKKNCEIILRVLQKEKNTLMSYLRPLIYDTLCKNEMSWKNGVGKGGRKERFESTAVDCNKQIEMRLSGIVKKYKGSSGIPLSTEGQVNFIIGEATNEDNLTAMFYGWMPWL